MQKSLLVFGLLAMTLVGALIFTSFSQKTNHPGKKNYAVRNRCACATKTTEEGEAYRYEAKHQTDFSGYKTIKWIITPDTVRNWESKYPSGTNVNKHTARIPGTPENRLYTLTGYLYMVKTEGDCDLHLEIGNADPGDLRTVAEITRENCTLQNDIISKLRSMHFPLNKRTTSGVKCTLTGPGFYDGCHPLKTASRYECGSSWEIHPVLTMSIGK